jgi:uncharacterized protein (TIGR02145 family)
VQTKAPTETEDGEETRTCTLNPSHKETRSVAALNHTHNWGGWQEATPATCAAEGEARRTCTLNATHYETQPIDKLIWGEWTITTPATSTTLAKGRRICPNGDIDEQDMAVCGTTPFAPEEEFCQSPDVVKDRCGSATYEATQFCQSPNVVKDLCGTATYEATQFCQSPNVVKDLCGAATYEATQFCQSPNVVKDLCGTATFTAAEGCCGSNKYTLAIQFCDARDSKIYKFVSIGSGATSQTWMAENLNHAASGSKCGSTLSGTGTVGDANTSTCDAYGRLYNWATAMAGATTSSANPSGVKGVCPTGWHLPSDAEWGALMQFVNPSCSAAANCANAGTYLKATSGWNSNGNGTDAHGFSALPGGFGGSSGFFDGVGGYGYWWSATESNASYAYGRSMSYSYAGVLRDDDDKTILYSVRCVQD